MSLLDVDHKKLGQNVVLHFSHIPGKWEEENLALGENQQDCVYEQRRGRKVRNSSFRNRGYGAFLPVCNPRIIRNRQDVIKYFLNDFPEMSRYFPILNMFHLITEYSSHLDYEVGNYVRDRVIANPFEPEEGARVLERYLSEIEKLKAEFFRSGGLMSRLATEYERRTPTETVRQMIEVCKRGTFDNLILVRDGNSFKVSGVIKRYRPREDRSVDLGSHDLAGNIGWQPEDFVKHGFFLAKHVLDELYAPLAALYQEASYMHRRKQQDKRVCFPRINEIGLFEMVEGEPILRTPEPVEWRTFRFDRQSSRTLLNGLHSGGKTHLLCDIPLYIIRGLRGFPLPSLSAKIPITRRIFHSLYIQKQESGGSLESEMTRRAEEIREARMGDLFLIDEFLQHASPDAADPLEPIILDEYDKTRATFIIVDHRGTSIDDRKWNFWSPGFKENETGEVSPTYKFMRGRPSQELLRRHASQMIRRLVKEPQEKEERLGYESFNTRDLGELLPDWLLEVKQRILSGAY
jgi:hypothetical protein